MISRLNRADVSKRVFDIVAIAVFSPILIILLALSAFWVLVASGSPVFFKQVRVGRLGRPFHILKLRTMAPPTGHDTELTAGADPRVTRVGRVLRKWKLDELPQIINILRGDMSLVGPRPEVPRYIDLIPEPERSVLLQVRPGLTDEASIKYRSEAELLGKKANPAAFYIEQILPDKAKMGAAYARNHTLSGDFIILIRTVARIAGVIM